MSKHVPIHVIPEAETNTVKDADDGILKVLTTEPATAGKANKAAITLMQEYLDTNQRIRIVSGHKQQRKILAIDE